MTRKSRRNWSREFRAAWVPIKIRAHMWQETRKCTNVLQWKRTEHFIFFEVKTRVNKHLSGNSVPAFSLPDGDKCGRLSALEHPYTGRCVTSPSRPNITVGAQLEILQECLICKWVFNYSAVRVTWYMDADRKQKGSLAFCELPSHYHTIMCGSVHLVKANLQASARWLHGNRRFIPGSPSPADGLFT